jgi:hypothetical protein
MSSVGNARRNARKRVPPAARRRALKLLAASRDGCTDALMFANGFTAELLVELVRVGAPRRHRDDRATPRQSQQAAYARSHISRRIALPVAGDDDAAKTVVLKLVEELGFDGVDAGGLDESWRQQPGAPVYTKDFDADGVRRALSEASKDRTPEWRGTSNSPGSFSAPA